MTHGYDYIVHTERNNGMHHPLLDHIYTVWYQPIQHNTDESLVNYRSTKFSSNWRPRLSTCLSKRKTRPCHFAVSARMTVLKCFFYARLLCRFWVITGHIDKIKYHEMPQFYLKVHQNTFGESTWGAVALPTLPSLGDLRGLRTPRQTGGERRLWEERKGEGSILHAILHKMCSYNSNSSYNSVMWRQPIWYFLYRYRYDTDPIIVRSLEQ